MRPRGPSRLPRGRWEANGRWYNGFAQFRLKTGCYLKCFGEVRRACEPERERSGDSFWDRLGAAQLPAGVFTAAEGKLLFLFLSLVIFFSFSHSVTN